MAEHLSQHATGSWEKTANLKQSLSQAFELTEGIKKWTRNPKRAESVVHADEAPLQYHTVTQGFVGLENSEIFNRYVVKYHSDFLLKLEMNFSDIEPVASSSNNQIHPSNIISQISQKRVMEAQVLPPIKRARTVRHCIRCGQPAGQCNGASAWFRCQHNCRDCGEGQPKICAGRSSKAPEKSRCGPPTTAELTAAARKYLF